MSIYDYLYRGSALAILLMLVYTTLHFIPFSWFVDVKSVTTNDACIGATQLWVDSERTPLWDIRGKVYAEIVEITDERVSETTIYREDNFGYETADGFSRYPTSWNRKGEGDQLHAFYREGTYGINSWVEIYPLPFITIKQFEPYTDDIFNVVECTDETINTNN